MNSDDPDFPVDPEETDNDVHQDDEEESLMDDLPLPEPVAAPVDPVIVPPLLRRYPWLSRLLLPASLNPSPKPRRKQSRRLRR